MDVTTIQMERAEAQERLEQYRTVLRNRHSQAVEREYDAILKGYEQLAKGTPLIDVRQAIREAGVVVFL